MTLLPLRKIFLIMQNFLAFIDLFGFKYFKEKCPIPVLNRKTELPI